MHIEIDLRKLNEDERYELRRGLEQIESPSLSCRAAITALSQMSTASFNKFLRDHPEAAFM